MYIIESSKPKTTSISRKKAYTLVSSYRVTNTCCCQPRRSRRRDYSDDEDDGFEHIGGGGSGRFGGFGGADSNRSW